jgi:hypothetical protein
MKYVQSLQANWDPLNIPLVDPGCTQTYQTRCSTAQVGRPVDGSLLTLLFLTFISVRAESRVRPRGVLSCGIDATSLFSEYPDLISLPWHKHLLFKMKNVQMAHFFLRHGVRVRHSTFEIILHFYIAQFRRSSKTERSWLHPVTPIRFSWGKVLGMESMFWGPFAINILLVGHLRFTNNFIYCVNGG